MGRSLANSYRLNANGWVVVHAEGDPSTRGFQIGYHLATEIADCVLRLAAYVKQGMKKSWEKYRYEAGQLYSGKLPEEQREEIVGMAKGAARAGRQVGWPDILAANAYFDYYSYYSWLKHGKKRSFARPPCCSAFAATGKSTSTGKILMAHNTWFGYGYGSAGNVILSIKPEDGYPFVMQCFPGFVHSGTDWYLNSQALMVCETTLTGMRTYNPNGIPSFTRARQAIQYSKTIDQWVRRMVSGNNGGYANTWLLGDGRTSEIAMLELGTYHHRLSRTSSGFFSGCNIALDPSVRQETEFNYRDKTSSPHARLDRWGQLLKTHRRLGVSEAKLLISDHYDVTTHSSKPSARTICGHVEDDPRGISEWEWPPFFPGGTFDAKVTSSELAGNGSFWAHWGKPCDIRFSAKPYIKRHPRYRWQANVLRDLEPYPWTLTGGFW